MTLQLSKLKFSSGSRKWPKRVGRGNASGHGTYSGRGQKGQRARSGGKKGLKLKGIKPIIKRLPKVKGFKSIHSKPVIINLDTLERYFKEDEIVNPKKLFKLEIIPSQRTKIKILGSKKLSKKLIVQAHNFSKSAEDAIKKAGGKVIKL